MTREPESQEHEVRSTWKRGSFAGLHTGWPPVPIETEDGRPVAVVSQGVKAAIIADHIVALHNARLAPPAGIPMQVAPADAHLNNLSVLAGEIADLRDSERQLKTENASLTARLREAEQERDEYVRRWSKAEADLSQDRVLRTADHVATTTAEARVTALEAALRRVDFLLGHPRMQHYDELIAKVVSHALAPQ